MTREIIDKLDNKYKTFLNNRKEVLSRTNRKDDVIGEIRGYLKGLVDCDIISELEFRALYSYYTLWIRG